MKNKYKVEDCGCVMEATIPVTRHINPECTAHTTVWTNHGKPQEIDEKFGPDESKHCVYCNEIGHTLQDCQAVKDRPRHLVALPTESETEATRHAKHSPLPWEYHPNGADDGLDSCFCQVGQPREYGFIDIDANAAYIVEACNNYERVKSDRDLFETMYKDELSWHNDVKAQRDELLAALKAVFDIVENEIGYRVDSEFEHERRYAQSMIQARAAIAKVEGSK